MLQQVQILWVGLANPNITIVQSRGNLEKNIYIYMHSVVKEEDTILSYWSDTKFEKKFFVKFEVFVTLDKVSSSIYTFRSFWFYHTEKNPDKRLPLLLLSTNMSTYLLISARVQLDILLMDVSLKCSGIFRKIRPTFLWIRRFKVIFWEMSCVWDLWGE